MKNIFIILFVFIIRFNSFGQDNFYLSQYFQAGPVINPALTGIENFLDLKLNYRNQWTGFTDAPSTNYLGVNGYLQKETQQAYKQYGLRTSNPYYLDSLGLKSIPIGERLRHGLGANIIYDTQGPYQRISGLINYALHIPVSAKMKLSVGLAGNISNQRIDFEKISLQNPNIDDFYQSLIAAGGRSTFLGINPGIALYAETFYISYSPQDIIRVPLSSDEIPIEDGKINHLIMAGVNIRFSEHVSLLPSLLISQNEAYTSVWQATARTLIKNRAWSGLSYRSTETLTLMAGVYLNNLFNLSYSYDYVMGDLNNYTNGSHELILGLMLFKKDTKAPYLW